MHKLSLTADMVGLQNHHLLLVNLVFHMPPWFSQEILFLFCTSGSSLLVYKNLQKACCVWFWKK